MLNDHHRVASFRQSAEDLHQLVHIGKMQTGGRFIQNVDCPSGTPAGELRRQLDALCLAAGQLRRRLSQLDIAEADIIERLYLIMDGRHILKEGQRLLHRHIEHIVDIFPLVPDLQRLPVIALSMADLAGNIYIGQEVHLNLDDAVAAARLTAAALHVEAEPPLCESSRPCIRRSREKIPDHIEHTRIGGRIGPRRPADRRLIDIDHLVELFDAVYAITFSGNDLRMVQLPRERLVEHLIHQRALAGTGDSRDHGHDAQRKGNINMLQVVHRRAADREPPGRFPALLRDLDPARAGEILPCEGGRILHNLRRRARRDDLAAVRPGAGSDVHNIVGRPHRVLIVLHDNHGVAEIAEPFHRVEQLVIIPLMQTDARLVKNVAHPHQAGADLRRKSDPLCLAAGQRRGGPGQRQIIQPDVRKKADPRADLLQNLLPDHRLCPGEREILEKFLQLRDRQRRHFIDIFAAHRDRE